MKAMDNTNTIEWWVSAGLIPTTEKRFHEWMMLGANVNRRLMVVEDCVYCMGRRGRKCATCDGLGIVMFEKMEL